MTLVADESVDKQIVDALRSDGHEVIFIAESAPGISDREVLEQARERGELLVTADKDFGELVFRQRLVHSGLLLLRLAGLDPSQKANLVAFTLRDRGEKLLFRFAVLTPTALRIRPLS